MNKKSYNRLQEIYSEMNSLLEEAKKLIRQGGNSQVYERALAYWINQIKMSLDDGRRSASRSSGRAYWINQIEMSLDDGGAYNTTMKKTIQELEKFVDEELDE